MYCVYGSGWAGLVVHGGYIHSHHRAHHSIRGECGLQVGPRMCICSPVPVVHHCRVGCTVLYVCIIYCICIYVYNCVYAATYIHSFIHTYVQYIHTYIL